jgi:hypothetical protein
MTVLYYRMLTGARVENDLGAGGYISIRPGVPYSLHKQQLLGTEMDVSNKLMQGKRVDGLVSTIIDSDGALMQGLIKKARNEGSRIVVTNITNDDNPLDGTTSGALYLSLCTFLGIFAFGGIVFNAFVLHKYAQFQKTNNRPVLTYSFCLLSLAFSLLANTARIVASVDILGFRGILNPTVAGMAYLSGFGMSAGTLISMVCYWLEVAAQVRYLLYMIVFYSCDLNASVCLIITKCSQLCVSKMTSYSTRHATFTPD